MRKAVSRKISIFLTGFILLAWAAFGPISICRAGMHELSDGDMAAVYASGFSEFNWYDGGTIARVDFNGVTLSTWTTMDSMKMGYYNKGGTTAWDNDWTNVSLGSASTDLIVQGFFIEAKFSDTADPDTRQLDYVRIGTKNLTGDITADFNSFSGNIYGAGFTSRDTTMGTQTISAPANTGFYLSLERSGTQMGYSFHWVSSPTTPTAP